MRIGRVRLGLCRVVLLRDGRLVFLGLRGLVLLGGVRRGGCRRDLRDGPNEAGQFSRQRSDDLVRLFLPHLQLP